MKLAGGQRGAGCTGRDASAPQSLVAATCRVCACGVHNMHQLVSGRRPKHKHVHKHTQTHASMPSSSSSRASALWGAAACASGAPLMLTSDTLLRALLPRLSGLLLVLAADCGLV